MDIQHQPNQFNMPNYSPQITGNPLVDTGISAFGQYAYGRAGGQGTPRFIPPYSPGMNQMQYDMAVNQIGPMRQQYMQSLNQNVQPVTQMLIQGMRSAGRGDWANTLQQNMNTGGFVTQLSAMSNQAPFVEQMMGGNVFRGHEEFLKRAGNFGMGTGAVGAQGVAMRNTDMMRHADELSRSIMAHTYTDPATGKMDIRGNPMFTAGWSGEQLQMLASDMAAKGMGQMAVDPVSGGVGRMSMSDMGTNVPAKLMMTNQLARATAATSSVTGMASPVENLRYLQKLAGPGPASRDIGTLMSIASDTALIGGAATATGVDSGTLLASRDAVTGGVDQRMSLMADPSGGTQVSSSLGRAMGKSAAYNVAAEAGATGAKTPEDVAAMTSKYGKQKLAKFNSTEFRQVTMAMHVMESSPAAAMYQKALQQSVREGNMQQTKQLIKKISQASGMGAGGIARVSANNAAFSDFIQTSEERLRTTGTLSGRTVEQLSEDIDRVTDQGQIAEHGQRGMKLVDKTKRDYARNLAKRMGVGMGSKAELASNRLGSIMESIDQAAAEGRISQEQYADLKEKAGAGGEPGLRSVKALVAHDPSLAVLKEEVERADMRGQERHYNSMIDRHDSSKGHSRDWVKGTQHRLKATAHTKEQKKFLSKKMKEINKIKDPEARGKAMEEFIKSPDYEKIGGGEAGRKRELDRLSQSRQEMTDERAVARSGVAQPMIAHDKLIRELGSKELRSTSRGMLDPMEQMGMEAAAAENVKAEEAFRFRSAQEGTPLQKGIMAVSEGRMTMKEAARLANIDVSELDGMGQGGGPADQAAAVREQRGRMQGQNTVSEVVLKEGSVITIVEGGNRKTARVTTGGGR